jgi:hypothetical protein
MIPTIELGETIAIIIMVIFVSARLMYCKWKFPKQFMVQFLLVAILTSVIWCGFGWYCSMPVITKQFVLAIIIYLIMLGWVLKS